MFLASDAKMGASLSSAALQVTPEKANAVLTPIFFLHVNLSVRVCAQDTLESFLGLSGPCCSRQALLARDNESLSPECVHMLGRTLCALDQGRSLRKKGSVQDRPARRKMGRGFCYGSCSGSST